MSAGVNPYRWRIVALLFAATTLNYIDRSLLGVLAPVLQYRVFHWSDTDFAAISMAFKLAYGIGLLSAGALIDRWGTRLGYLISIIVWSSFSLLHTIIRPTFGMIGFVLVRFGLGLGEAGNFPAAVKAVASWFPASERALATGLFNAGANVGAILAPLLVALLVQPSGSGWQRVFFVTSSFSALWCVLWFRAYHEPHDLQRLEGAALSDRDSGPPRRAILSQPITWGVSTLRLADAAWWFYLFWGGKFLFDQFGLDIQALALPLVIIYALADAGSIAGGWLSSRLIRRGWPTGRARKFTMLCCALLILPVSTVTRLGTQFEVGEPFFATLAHSGTSLAPEQRTALEQMQGQRFASAREFAVALESASTAAPLSAALEAAVIAAARSNQLYWLATLLIALAAAGHQAWSANMFSMIGDYLPRQSVASVVGFSGMVGVIAALVADYFLGHALLARGPEAYFAAFVGAGSVYLIVLGLFNLLVPPSTPTYG
jgi:MFS transporter, ACS family, aldohexuronate transporter